MQATTTLPETTTAGAGEFYWLEPLPCPRLCISHLFRVTNQTPVPVNCRWWCSRNKGQGDRERFFSFFLSFFSFFSFFLSPQLAGSECLLVCWRLVSCDRQTIAMGPELGRVRGKPRATPDVGRPVLMRATTELLYQYQCLCRLFIRQAVVCGLAIRRDEIL